MRQAACVAVVLIALAAVSAAQARPGPFHMDALKGTVAKVGVSTSARAPFPLYAVELDATACFRSLAEAQQMYPSEVRITHFAITGSPKRWGPPRTVIEQQPGWLVPVGEMWQGGAGTASSRMWSRRACSMPTRSATRTAATAWNSRAETGCGTPQSR